MEVEDTLVAGDSPATGAEDHGSAGHPSRWWATAVAALVVSRVISTLVVTVSGQHRHLSVLGSWTQWDSGFYITAARVGWPHQVNPHVFNVTAFFPALPLAIRAVHLTGLSWKASGVAVNVVFEVTMALAISALVHDRLSLAPARRAVWLVLLFPGAYILPQVYSEPMFVTFAALSLLCLSRGRRDGGARWWVLAGLAAALSSATRPTGLVVAVCCLWVAVAEIRRRRAWSALIAPVLSPVGLVAFCAFLGVRTGDALAYVHTDDDAWKQTPTIKAIPQQISLVLHHHWRDLPYLLMLALGVVALVALARMVHRGVVPAEWFIYGLGCTLIVVESRYLGFRPRFAFTAFPLIVAAAYYLRGRWYQLAVAASVVGLATLAYLTPRFVP